MGWTGLIAVIAAGQAEREESVSNAEPCEGRESGAFSARHSHPDGEDISIGQGERGIEIKIDVYVIVSSAPPQVAGEGLAIEFGSEIPEDSGALCRSVGR